jgi:hypothetical protein
MKYPRDILIVFALLDALILVRSVNTIRLPDFRHGMPVWASMLSLLRPVFLLSLAVSAIGLAAQRKWGFIVSYAQFPFRFVYVLLSFGFLSRIPCLFIANYPCQSAILVAMGLECGRLVWTIQIHRWITRPSTRRR